MDYKIGCAANAKNTGINQLCQDIGAIVGFMVCPWDYTVDTIANAKLQATWTTAIQADAGSRIYPFPPIFLHEDNSEETTFQEGALGSIFVRDGKVQWSFTIETSRLKHEALKSHTNSKVSIVFIDQQGRLQGVRNANQEFLAINQQRFTVENIKPNNGTEGTTSMVSMVFDDTEQFQTMPATVIPSFNAKGLEGLIDVELTESGSSTGSLVTIDAQILQSGTSVLGLSDTVDEDWQVLDSTGTAETPNTITDNGDGTYSFAFTVALTAGDYTFNLKTPATMTTTGYESTGAVTVTIA